MLFKKSLLNGWAASGSSWNHVKFDNFHLEQSKTYSYSSQNHSGSQIMLVCAVNILYFIYFRTLQITLKPAVCAVLNDTTLTEYLVNGTHGQIIIFK